MPSNLNLSSLELSTLGQSILDQSTQGQSTLDLVHNQLQDKALEEQLMRHM
ncbi:hypothetical protein [Reinekea sp.]|uniref:hypothetical protein n=1 Tax=Reinekea sp. TaxID=1970455 RepID=UPI002A80E121|nr:hypothetical protein [Reinekea sp.]